MASVPSWSNSQNVSKPDAVDARIDPPMTAILLSMVAIPFFGVSVARQVAVAHLVEELICQLFDCREVE
jgi:hypothetical protein